MNKNKCYIAFSLTVLILLSGCASQPETHGNDLPGFFTGLMHGFFFIFSFIASLFSDVRIYTFPNSGVWYDFGFLVGLVSAVSAGTSVK
ncbi:hypothetical protein [Ferrimonas sp. SCSIO 43195]|uniref:hypothetical protein n=1 Tax=Ferrimonas sp. SCSIO 43195 TaxID=2822844 RepID=UPI002075D1A6|nr:hypothetical protein [Ferrimonas sp. SCSIO 43195]USD36179.1 hypothetical protein J8Z22_14180 [Ferrimonas sp. SCSIO 43195]